MVVISVSKLKGWVNAFVLLGAAIKYYINCNGGYKEQKIKTKKVDTKSVFLIFI